MKLALIAPGVQRIPPVAWGPIEETIWQRKLHLEQRGHTVEIFNSMPFPEIVYTLNQRDYDFIHLHQEFFAGHFAAHLRRPFVISNHNAGLQRFGRGEYPGYETLLKDCLGVPGCIALSDETKEIFRSHGYRRYVRVVPNAVECANFEVKSEGNGRVICVGTLSKRKRQAEIANATEGRVAIDFVGRWNRNWEDFKENETARHLGEWTREEIHKRLTEYSCLVLLSNAEVAPKVVLEAMAAGVSVVTNDRCTANLTEQEFIKVLPSKDFDGESMMEALGSAVENNNRLRPHIVEYARAHHDNSVQIPKYLQAIEEFRDTMSAWPTPSL